MTGGERDRKDNTSLGSTAGCVQGLCLVREVHERLAMMGRRHFEDLVRTGSKAGALEES